MPFRLESLRRSTWLAGFLLLVCLMRVGMVMACAPHDIAESLAGGAHAVVAEQVGDDSTSSDPSPAVPVLVTACTALVIFRPRCPRPSSPCLRFRARTCRCIFNRTEAALLPIGS